MTKIKICGLTQKKDVLVAVDAGADAIGFVMYPSSPRAVSLEHANELAKYLPLFVTPVLLFVNASHESIAKACQLMPHALLQFHGDDSVETPDFCASFKRPYLKVARIKREFDLLKYLNVYTSARAILLDTYCEAYGGSGKTFDWDVFNWSQFSISEKRRLVLSGGLTCANVAKGIELIRPWAVDVSSAVESEKGIKDEKKINDFIRAVRCADLSI